MADKQKNKEVGGDGLPIQRIGGKLIGNLHDSITFSIDDMLRTGWLSDEEYVQLVTALNAAVDAFRQGAPGAVLERPYGMSAEKIAYQQTVSGAASQTQPYMEGMLMSKEKQQAGNVLAKWATNLVEQVQRVVSKASFDDSAWNGDAAQWKTAEAYCASCLIDLNTSGGAKTKDKCHLPVRKPGSSSINRNALRALASGARGIGALKGVPPADKAKAANFAISHWQAAFGKPAPDSMYRMAGKAPPSSKAKDMSSASFFKDKGGNWWMLGIYSNRWKDSQNEILSLDAHKEFANWVNTTGFEPAVTISHQPRLSQNFWLNVFRTYGNNVPLLNDIVSTVYKDFGFARVKRIIPMNGFAVALAKVDLGKEKIAEELSKVDSLGMSHGCVSFKESTADFSSGKKPVTIVEGYRSFEVTALRRSKAANAVTLPIFMEAKAMTTGLSDEDRTLLKQVLPADLVDNVDQITSTLESELSQRLEFKDVPEDEGEEETPVEGSGSPEQPAAEELVATIVKALNLEGLQQVIGGLTSDVKALKSQIGELDSLRAVVKELQKSDDEKIAGQISRPALPGLDWGAVPSQSPTNVVGPDKVKLKIGDEKLDPAGSENKIDPNNPLHAMVWGQFMKR